MAMCRGHCLLMITQFMLLALLPTSFGSDYCRATDKNPYSMFGEKTLNNYDHQFKSRKLKDCQPLQMWFIARHGANFPTKEEIKSFRHNLVILRDEIVSNHDKHQRGKLCKEDLANLRKWNMSYTIQDRKHSRNLRSYGAREMSNLGIATYSLSEDLFGDMPPEQTIFQFSPGLEMERSVNELAESIIFEKLDTSNDHYNKLLDPGNRCRWKNEKERHGIRTEEKKFEEGDLVKSMVERVSKRLGFTSNQSQEYMNLTSLVQMWKMCAYDTPIDSSWCAAFDTEDLKVMEYYEDLSYYYSLGYGNEDIYKMGCPLLKDMMDRFNQLTQENTKDLEKAPKGIFYVVDKGILLPLLVSLGIGKPKEPLMSDNYLEMQDREWRTSKLILYGAHFKAIFYKCEKNQYKVALFHNFEPVKLPGCNDHGVCKWKQFTKMYQNIVDSSSCDDRFCEASGASRIKSHLWPFLIVWSCIKWYIGSN